MRLIYTNFLYASTYGLCNMSRASPAYLVYFFQHKQTHFNLDTFSSTMTQALIKSIMSRRQGILVILFPYLLKKPIPLSFCLISGMHVLSSCSLYMMSYHCTSKHQAFFKYSLCQQIWNISCVKIFCSMGNKHIVTCTVQCIPSSKTLFFDVWHSSYNSYNLTYFCFHIVNTSCFFITTLHHKKTPET